MPISKPELDKRAFDFIRMNDRGLKPRKTGLTEIRGPYYSVMGLNYLTDVLETMGPYIDSLKFAGGSFALFSREKLREMIDLCHQFGVEVSTGGFIEHVLSSGEETVHRYIRECAEFGFDTIELSAGFVTIPTEDWVRLIQTVRQAGLKAKPEIGIQFGAGGASRAEELEAEGAGDPGLLIHRAKKFLDAGASILMIESEGITENVAKWRTDVPALLANAVGIERVMFEAADPEAFGWYIKTFGPEVNLFVDHSQIVQLECLRSGFWGTKSLWGRVVTFKEREEPAQVRQLHRAKNSGGPGHGRTGSSES